MDIKRLLIKFGIVIGNIFLSYGLFFVWMGLCYLCRGLGDIFRGYQQFLLIVVCAVQIAVNVILYKKLLKRHFKPVEKRKTALYFLMPVIGCAFWIGSFALSTLLDLELWEDSPYIGYLIFFLPTLLLALIPLAVVYRIFFRKNVSEANCTYLLSVLGIAIIPVTFTVLMIGTG